MTCVCAPLNVRSNVQSKTRELCRQKIRNHEIQKRFSPFYFFLSFSSNLSGMGKILYVKYDCQEILIMAFATQRDSNSEKSDSRTASL